MSSTPRLWTPDAARQVAAIREELLQIERTTARRIYRQVLELLDTPDELRALLIHNLTDTHTGAERNERS